MPDRRESDAGPKGNAILQITLAIITVSGVIATALFANWDKMFGTHTAAPAPAGQQAANAGSGASPPQQGSGQPSSASQPAGSSAAPAEEPPTPPVEGAGSGGRASAAQPNAAGLYRDTDGYSYDIRQQGNAIAFQQIMNGAVVGQGQGIIEGRTMRYGYSAANNDSGNCVAQLSESGREISGRCQSASSGQSRPFIISR